MTTRISSDGVRFVRALEGTVLHAYRDSGGLITIGIGFTMRSAAFSSWWTAKHGRPLRMGDTMTVAECEEVLPSILAEEYIPPILRKFGNGLPQNQLDQCTSTVYNCGAGTLGDRWANALATGNVAEAARLLRTTRVTAAGKYVRGLTNRREEEAELLAQADYRIDFGKEPGAPGTVAGNISTAPEDVRAYQRQLAALGYFLGTVDGRVATSDAAVRAFQRDQRIEVDGKVGPATRARLRDAILARQSVVASGGGAVAGGGTAGASDAIVTAPTQAPTPVDGAGIPDVSAIADPINWSTVGLVALGVAVVVGAAYTLYRYRFAILGKAERAIPGLKRITGSLRPAKL